MATYLFSITVEPDGDGWRAFYAPLEHLGASTWGVTEEEALHNIQDVLSMIVEEFAEEGKSLPTGEGLAITKGAVVSVTV